MAADDENKNKEEKVEVPLKTLTDIQERMAKMELDLAEKDNKMAGLEELLSKAGTEGEPKLREKKSFEPKFRTVRLRKFPIAGDIENLGWVIGWSSRGAHQKVDRTGISPQIIDFIDIAFLGQEKNADGKPKFEEVKLLDFMNQGIQVHCKILDTKKENKKVETGEEINVSVFDPQHGLISTGDVVDGYTAYSEIMYLVQIPGIAEPVWVDSLYCNA